MPFVGLSVTFSIEDVAQMAATGSAHSLQTAEVFRNRHMATLAVVVAAIESLWEPSPAAANTT
eukprot:COSAG01_NODE_1812_length_9179_cov_36.648789_5_plen_63_part_00